MHPSRSPGSTADRARAPGSSPRRVSSLGVRLFLIALGLSVLGGLGGLLVASGILLINDSRRARLIPWLVSYAVGALLGVSMLAILPEALNHLSAERVFGTLLVGILIFFVLEKLVLWRHCHTHDCEVHDGSVFPVLIGDAFQTCGRRSHRRAVMTSVRWVSAPHSRSPRTIFHRRLATSPSVHAGYSRRRALRPTHVPVSPALVGRWWRSSPCSSCRWSCVLPGPRRASFCTWPWRPIPGCTAAGRRAFSTPDSAHRRGCGDGFCLRPISRGLSVRPRGRSTRRCKEKRRTQRSSAWQSLCRESTGGRARRTVHCLAAARHTRFIAASAPPPPQSLPERLAFLGGSDMWTRLFASASLVLALTVPAAAQQTSLQLFAASAACADLPTISVLIRSTPRSGRNGDAQRQSHDAVQA